MAAVWRPICHYMVRGWHEYTPNTLDEMIIPNEQNESSDEEDDDGSDNESCISSDEDN